MLNTSDIMYQVHSEVKLVTFCPLKAHFINI